jgi:uncharacterized protein YjdB
MKRLAVAVFIILTALFFKAHAQASSVEYFAHVQNIGWMDLARDGQQAGTTGQGLQMEAIRISVKGLPNAHITYQAHVGGHGWHDWMRDGQVAGTTGQGRRIEAVRIRLENAPGWSVTYQVHAAGIGWMGWVKDGEVAGTTGQGRRIEAVAIKLQPPAVTPEATQMSTGSGGRSVEYVAHVQNIGWMDLAKDGQTAGTTGQGLQMEAIRISVKGLPNAHITYQAHVGGYGWHDWMRDGQVAGTTGQGRQIEAVRIRLENAPGWSVTYQVHAKGIGWMGWVKDGEVAGTTGQGRRIEAVAIKLQPATQEAIQTPQTQPGQTTTSQSAPAQADNCVSLNPNTATVANVQGSWKVVDGNRWLFDFGQDKAAADRSLSLIKTYGMNQSCSVGSPQASFTYMLVAGRAPAGSVTGEDCLPFNPSALSVANVQGNWTIVEGNAWRFSFGSKEADARQALAIIQRYGFSQSCYVARPNPRFSYLKAGTAAAGPPTQQPPQQSPQRTMASCPVKLTVGAAAAVNFSPVEVNIQNSGVGNGFVECSYRSYQGDVSNLVYKYTCPDARKEATGYAHAYSCAK